MATTFQSYHLQSVLINWSRSNWFDVSDFESSASASSESVEPLHSLPVLPPQQIHFEPFTNIKTITTWHTSPNTIHKIRTTKKIRLSDLHAHEERVKLHLTLRKFGAEAGNPRGASNGKITSVGDDFPLYLGPDWREIERREQLEAGSLKSVICRICGDEHYTVRCKYSSINPLPEPAIVQPENQSQVVQNKYIPPSLRGTTSSTHSSANSLTEHAVSCLRVSHISHQITEDEFIGRFSRFGKVIRAFLPRDYTTGEYRGYGYITFLRRESAQRALEVMDRRGYDNLIMRVGWDERPLNAVRVGKTKL